MCVMVATVPSVVYLVFWAYDVFFGGACPSRNQKKPVQRETNWIIIVTFLYVEHEYLQVRLYGEGVLIPQESLRRPSDPDVQRL